MLMDKNDKDIIDKLRSERVSVRSGAIEQVYVKHYPLIRAYVLKNNGSTSDAEDIFQDAMIVTYAKVRNRDFELTCALQTYIYSVCRNLWLNRLKEKNRFSDFMNEGSYVSVAEENFDPLIVEEKHERIKKLFAQIDEKCQKVLHLYYFHRLSMKSIAKEMGFANEQVSKNKKSRCLKKLKALVLNTSKDNSYG